jgi:hypothetical protein
MIHGENGGSTQKNGGFRADLWESLSRTAGIKIVINAGDEDLPSIRMGFVIYDS